MSRENFWANRRVFLTGHTGFKGSWLSMWLSLLGAKVTGYSLLPDTSPNLYELCQVRTLLENEIIGDVRNAELLERSMKHAEPEIVIHMAAQPLVLESYRKPAETYMINAMGTVHLFEAVRKTASVKAVVNVTTDKCYENKEWVWGYRENEPLGGYDPYSSSKACAELITASYRNSYFNGPDRAVAIASARAGNVIGGGDWAENRLVPDCIRSLLNDKPIVIRSPNSIRPWQHVLEPLYGYLLLAQRLMEDGSRYASAWNFGPSSNDVKPVKWIVEKICAMWGSGAGYKLDSGSEFHEARLLSLDCTKAHVELRWRPRWNIEHALHKIIEWTRAYQEKQAVRELCFKQIEEYLMADGE